MQRSSSLDYFVPPPKKTKRDLHNNQYVRKAGAEQLCRAKECEMHGSGPTYRHSRRHSSQAAMYDR